MSTRVQMVIVDPDHCGQGTSVVVGFMQSPQDFQDFDLMLVMFQPTERKAHIDCALLEIAQDNARDRQNAPAEMNEVAFHNTLTAPLWRKVDAGVPTGEVAVVKTRLPGTPEGQHAYAFFGLVSGSQAMLKNMCSTLFEGNVTVKDRYSPAIFDLADTGIKVNHVMGSHLTQSLSQPVWGFGAEKVGMLSQYTLDAIKRTHENSRHLIDHGCNMPGFLALRPDPEYVRFLRQMDKQGMVPAPIWATQAHMDERDKVAKLAIQQSMADDASYSTPARTPHVSKSPSP